MDMGDINIGNIITVIYVDIADAVNIGDTFANIDIGNVHFTTFFCQINVA